ANELNKTKQVATASLLFNLASVLGLLQQNANAFLQGGINTQHIAIKLDDVGVVINQVIDGDAIENKITARITAKKAKNFAEADRIRKELADSGIILEDTPQGTTWRRA
ncbi:MAG TPA: cysteine--tRNA ligase, partial [Methylotenera sp.]|nr:cysteine--tRNA ligase [Methylotenera sp.]